MKPFLTLPLGVVMTFLMAMNFEVAEVSEAVEGRGGSGKRFSDHDDFGYQHKKVRGGRGGGERGLRRNYRSLDEEFDPFEPFEGPIRLPRSYLGSKNDGGGSASADSQAANSQRSEQNNAMSNGNE
ncbi:hypothetical protein NECAME_05479 [Necator americanus]|uniref:Uncharacterized protein n=1 Tax=Necator americanus TaxID=51031 RepID=W2SGL8_NECAM|nr:hypothetical protein NECAME_05479 [Necator americanus]ETN68754.1 hypothetical protein NECAME_05479 [Necator americanus]